MIGADLAFENFLMTQKLDELLKLLSQEIDEHKIIKIKRAIYLKVNYLGDDNRKLDFLDRYFHIKKIKKRYKNTKYEQYLVFKTTPKSRKIILTTLVLAIFMTGGYAYKELKSNFTNKSYVHNGVELSEERYLTLLNAKVKLSELYLTKSRVLTAYTNYNEALEIEDRIAKPTEEIDKRLEKVKENLLSLLMAEVEGLREIYQREDFKDRVSELLTVAENMEELNIQGKIYEIQGDLALEEFSLTKAKNFYILASKFSDNKNEMRLKEAMVSKIVKVNSMLEEVKILKLQNKNEEALQKYKEAVTLYGVGEEKGKVPQIDEKIESIKGEVDL